MYHFHEGRIELPQGWHDRTVNLMSSNLTGIGPTMSITRDEMPWGMGLDEYIDSQYDRFAKELKSFERLGRRDLIIDRLPAVELECRWISRQGKVHQLVTSVQDNLKIMSFTTSVPNHMDDAQKAEFRRLIATVKFGQNKG